MAPTHATDAYPVACHRACRSVARLVAAWVGQLVALMPWTPAFAAPAARPAAMMLGPSADEAAEAEVRARVREIAELMEASRFEDAEAVVAANIEAHPEPFTFLAGVLRESQGDCDGAVDAYRRFIAMDVPAKDAEAARAGIERCGETVELATVRPPDDPTPRASLAEVPPPGPDTNADHAEPASGDRVPRPSGGHWWADPAGGVLAIGGVATLAAGGVVWGQRRPQQRAAGGASRLSSYEARTQRAERLFTAGVALVGIGGALLLGGVIRYSIVAAREQRRQPQAKQTRALRWRRGAGLSLRF